MDSVRTMFVEYSKELGVDMCFQGFEDELESLPGRYAEPLGRILFAECDGDLAGIVAMRPTGDCDVEMKRLFVRPQARGQGIGRMLAEYLVEEARGLAHRAMILDTLPNLDAAVALYRDMGFEETAPYYDNPIEGVLYMRLEL